MPRRYLANSAVIPHGTPGTYRYTLATVEALRRFVAEPFESRIGYAETGLFIHRVTGIAPAPSRASMSLNPGDTAFVVRLRARLPDPAQKGQPVHATADDWELGLLERLA